MSWVLNEAPIATDHASGCGRSCVVGWPREGSARDKAPAPIEPVGSTPLAAPEPTTRMNAQSRAPDDTHDEGHEDPIAKIAELEARLDQQQAVIVGRQPRVIVGGYVDLGFFAPQGNGAGIIRDQGNVYFPQYAGKYGWVFLGDILSPADQHARRGRRPRRRHRRAAALRQHPLGRRAQLHRQRDQPDADLGPGADAPSRRRASTSRRARARTSAWATSSTSTSPSSSGCRPRSQKTSIFVGKIDSVLGIEYRERKSNQRFGITPSLIARYTTGTAVGVKVRSQARPRRCARRRGRRHERLVHAGAVSLLRRDRHQPRQDGSAGASRCTRPSPSTWSSACRARTAPQDRSPNVDGKMWFVGVDYQLHTAVRRPQGAVPEGRARPAIATNDVYGLRPARGRLRRARRLPAAALRRAGARRVPRRPRVAGRSDGAGRRQPRLPHEVVARDGRRARRLHRPRSCSRPSTCATASTAASPRSRTTSSRRRWC